MTSAAPYAGRWFTIVLTDHVDGVFGLPLRDRARCRDIFALPLNVAIRATLTRIGVAPADVVVDLWGDDPALFGPVSGHAAPQPLACFWSGAELDQIAAEIDQLRAAEWRPAPPLPVSSNPFNGARA